MGLRVVLVVAVTLCMSATAAAGPYHILDMAARKIGSMPVGVNYPGPFFPCPDGSSCPTTYLCCEEAAYGNYSCCPYSTGTCCDDTTICCAAAGVCCQTDDFVGCCSKNDECCGTFCCPYGWVCCNNYRCCDVTQGDECCGNICCTPQYPWCCQNVSSSSGCCPSGYPVCCPNNMCCPEGYECCQGGCCLGDDPQVVIDSSAMSIDSGHDEKRRRN